jgi:predicted dehydrogenase
MLKSLIVGFGRAGNHLHLHCLRKAHLLYGDAQIFSPVVGIVDPIYKAEDVRDLGLQYYCQLEAVRGFDPESTVVHICTPPEDHLRTIRRVAELGYTRIIVEKPLAISPGEVAQIRSLQKKWDLDLLVVAVWLSSQLTSWLKQAVDTKRYGRLLDLTIEQHKPRFLRTFRDTSHLTAFEVELPHQVALAFYLAGQESQVLDASCAHMQLGNKTIPYMGNARMFMQHGSGVHSILFSNLMASARERFVKLVFHEHTILGYFPASRDIHYSDLTVYDENSRVLESQRLEDDPLTTCFREYYGYYLRDGHTPISNLEFNASAISAIAQAKRLSGVPVLE